MLSRIMYDRKHFSSEIGMLAKTVAKYTSDNNGQFKYRNTQSNEYNISIFQSNEYNIGLAVSLYNCSSVRIIQNTLSSLSYI